MHGQRTRSNARGTRRYGWPDSYTILLMGVWRLSLGQAHGRNLRAKAQTQARVAMKSRSPATSSKGAGSVVRTRDQKKSLWRRGYRLAARRWSSKPQRWVRFLLPSGCVAERSKAADCKSVGLSHDGSNPSAPNRPWVIVSARHQPGVRCD